MVVLVVLVALVVAVPSSLAAGSSAAPAEAKPARQGELKVYVPVQKPRIEPAQVVAPRVPKPSRASKAVTASFDTAATVTFMQIPGTVVPLWWLALMLLAVPLARLWRRWTARMFT